MEVRLTAGLPFLITNSNRDLVMLTVLPRTCLWLGLAVGMLLVPGCGSKPKPTGRLHGKVTFEGKGVDQATLQIQSPKSGESFVAKTGSDGSFQFDVPVTTGEYLVTVLPVIDVPEAGVTPVTTKPPERSDIPAKYRSAETSGETVTVREGENEFNIDMAKK
jgi:hypothetical protein